MTNMKSEFKALTKRHLWWRASLCLLARLLFIPAFVVSLPLLLVAAIGSLEDRLRFLAQPWLLVEDFIESQYRAVSPKTQTVKR